MNECLLCGLDLKGIREAIEKEREIWRPLDCEIPEINLPSVWIETETMFIDSTTTTDAGSTWTIIND